MLEGCVTPDILDYPEFDAAGRVAAVARKDDGVVEVLVRRVLAGSHLENAGFVVRQGGVNSDRDCHRALGQQRLLDVLSVVGLDLVKVGEARGYRRVFVALHVDAPGAQQDSVANHVRNGMRGRRRRLHNHNGARDGLERASKVSQARRVAEASQACGQPYLYG